MKTLVGGGIAVLLGIIGLLVWWKAILGILAGFIPVMLLLGGGLAIYLGFDELKDTWKKGDDDFKTGDDQYISPVEAPKEEPKTVEKEAATKPKEEKEAKKTKEVSASGTILGIIEKNKEGVDADTIKKETGFTSKKIHNIVYKLKKQGKITSERKGFYKKA